MRDRETISNLFLRISGLNCFKLKVLSVNIYFRCFVYHTSLDILADDGKELKAEGHILEKLDQYRAFDSDRCITLSFDLRRLNLENFFHLSTD